MISYVVPVMNEEEGIEAFYSELTEEAKKISKEYEIIFIDDGSTDATLKSIKEFARKDSHIRIYSFRRNHGKSEALTLGFQMAKGKYIVTLDADLQDKPSEIHKLLEVIDGEWDVVSGWRQYRKDSGKIKIASKVFNFLARTFWGLKLHDYNCGLKVYTQEAARSLHLYGGFHRFIPLLAYQQGFAVTEVAVEHDKRKFGKSKYGVSKVWKDLPDIFTMLFLAKYSNRPLHFFGTIGAFLILVGAVSLLYLLWVQLNGHSIGRRPLLLFAELCVLAGVQISLTGFLADLIINTSQREITHHPLKYSSDIT